MCFIAAISAISVLPLAVGVHTSMLLFSSSPAFSAFSCAGLNSVMLSFASISFSFSGINGCIIQKEFVVNKKVRAKI